jgi:hypothetical protein
MINRTFEAPADMFAGYLTNTDFILKILVPEIRNYKSKNKIELFAPKKRKPAESLDLSKIVKIGSDVYSRFYDAGLKNLDASRQYYVLSGTSPLLFVRTEFGDDACGFVIRDMRTKYESKLEHWVDHYLAEKGRPWTAHIKLQGENPGKLVNQLYERIAGHYVIAEEK